MKSEREAEEKIQNLAVHGREFGFYSDYNEGIIGGWHEKEGYDLIYLLERSFWVWYEG